MDHIKFLLPQANASRGEGVEFSAAAVVAALNQVLRSHGFSEEQAMATSITQRRAKIVVSHGAIAGRLRQQSENIIDDANALVRQRFPERGAALEEFFTKLR